MGNLWPSHTPPTFLCQVPITKLPLLRNGPRPPLLLSLFLWGKLGLRCLQMSLARGALTTETNFSIKFIIHENGFSRAVVQGGETLSYLKHKFIYWQRGSEEQCEGKEVKSQWDVEKNIKINKDVALPPALRPSVTFPPGETHNDSYSSAARPFVVLLQPADYRDCRSRSRLQRKSVHSDCF